MFCRWSLWLLLALIVTGCSTSANRGNPTALIPAQTTIAVAKNAPKDEQDAATLLQKWLRRASGVNSGFDLQALEPGTKPDESIGHITLAVGNTTLIPTDARVVTLNDDGFLIHHAGSIIAIEGKTAAGTFYGAVAFLDRYAGVRFYLPTDLWTSQPANHAVIFDGQDYLSQPFVVSGFVTGVSTKALGDEDWLRRVGGSRRKGGTHQHDLNTIFPPEKFTATHPEIYPIYNGQRYIPINANDQTWQIDFTVPYALDAAEQSITDYFKTTPAAEYIAVSINDNNRWSQSDANQQIIEKFKAKDPKGNFTLEATSDIYWRFMNELAAWLNKKFPDKRLIGLAYGPTSGVPNFPLAENIVVFTNLHLSEYPYYVSPTAGPSPLLDQWLAVAHHYANHEWYEGDGYLLPRIYSGYWSQFMQKLAAHMNSAYMHAEAYPNWGFDGPKYYIMTRLWWNPRLDPKKLTHQFCEDMFGPAAPAMAAYFAQLETLWTQLDITDGPKRKLNAWPNQFATTPASRAMIAHCHQLLEQAAANAQTDEQKKRVTLFSKCFAFSESLFDLAAAPSDEARHAHAIALAKDLATDKWAVYKASSPMQAIEAIYKGPAKK